MTGNFVGAQQEIYRSLGSAAAGNIGPHDTWYVETSTTGGDGTSWVNAYDTLIEAVTAAGSNDTILLSGSLTENLTVGTTPANITLMGADGWPLNPLWSGANSAPLVICDAPGWKFIRVRFNFPTDYAGIQFRMDGSTQLAYCSTVLDCHFTSNTGTKGAIDLYGAPPCVGILNCVFDHIDGVGGAGLTATDVGFAFPLRMRFIGNIFLNCRNQVDLLGANNCIFVNNVFQGQNHNGNTVKHLYILGGRRNTVSQNIMGGDYDLDANSYKAATNDNWIGNYVEDVTAETSGISLKVPE